MRKIRTGAKNINRNSGRCIVLNEVTSPTDNYIDVINDNRDKCWSYVGMIGGKQKLNLGDWCLDESRGGGTGVVEHEFLHALGVYHEQARPDR